MPEPGGARPIDAGAGAAPHRPQELADQAHTLGLPALESRARLVWACDASDEVSEETALHRAARAALAAHDDAALADSWIRLCFHAGFHVGRAGRTSSTIKRAPRSPTPRRRPDRAPHTRRSASGSICSGSAEHTRRSPARFAVARALRASGGDPKRARELAISAREVLAPLAAKYGSIFLDTERESDTWLAAGAAPN